MSRNTRRAIRKHFRGIILISSTMCILAAVILVKNQDKKMPGTSVNTQAELKESKAEENETAMPTIEIHKENTTQAAGKFQDTHSMDWDADESYLLAKIAMDEAESESTEGKAMVILVVLNRVFSPEFPDTIEEVIFQDGQFSPIKSGRWDAVEPDTDCWAALDLVYAGWDESGGALYFEAEWNENTWHKDNLKFIKKVGKQNFYK
nr:MAG TPA: lytic transglycosylase [Caudoviricetes sp.]